MDSLKFFKAVGFLSLFFFATTMIAQDQEIQLDENISFEQSWKYSNNFDAQVMQITTDLLSNFKDAGSDPEGLMEFMQAYCLTEPRTDGGPQLIPRYAHYGLLEKVGQCVEPKQMLVDGWCVVISPEAGAYYLAAKSCTVFGN